MQQVLEIIIIQNQYNIQGNLRKKSESLFTGVEYLKKNLLI